MDIQKISNIVRTVKAESRQADMIHDLCRGRTNSKSSLSESSLVSHPGTTAGSRVSIRLAPYSTVTLFARFLGLSTSVPRATAVW